jgi:hypothetical protein
MVHNQFDKNDIVHCTLYIVHCRRVLYKMEIPSMNFVDLLDLATSQNHYIVHL